MHRRSFIAILVVVALVGCGSSPVSESPSIVPVSPTQPAQLKSSDVADAFQKAGLEIGLSRPMTTEDYNATKAGLVGKIDGTRFFIPSICDDCGGRIFIFDNKADYETQKQYYVGLGNKTFFSWLFGKPNDLLLVQINGELDESTAKKYQDVLFSIGTAAPAELAYVRATPGPTNTPRPTKTPAPTKTPKPTRTPSPTEAPTDVPTATPEPEPITINGSGKTVTDPVYIPFALARVTLAHDGSRNFIVTAFQGEDETGLTNAIGRYTGTRLIQGERETLFEVNADGSWFIMIEPLRFNSSIADEGTTGISDSISGLFTPTKIGAVPYRFTHDGERNFIVQLICAGGSDFVQNEIGAVDGEAVVRFKDGPCLWDVRADGNWTITPK